MDIAHGRTFKNRLPFALTYIKRKALALHYPGRFSTVASGLVLIIGKLPWLGQRYVESVPLWCDLGCDLVMLGALRSFPARIHIYEP